MAKPVANLAGRHNSLASGCMVHRHPRYNYKYRHSRPATNNIPSLYAEIFRSA
jgi:hypothetical protein